VSRAAIRDVVRELVDTLGSRIVAYIGGVSHTKFAHAWAAGAAAPRRETALRAALQASRIIGASESSNVVQAWFMGANTYLELEAPAAVLRNTKDPAALSRVVRAARAFTR
jgi:hypothetical protein